MGSSAVNENTFKLITKILGITTGIALLLYIGYLFLDVIIILVISLLVALIFNPLVSIMEKNGISRLLAVLVVFILAGFAIIFGFSVVIPKIISQMNAIAENLNQETISHIFQQVEDELKAYMPFLEGTDLAQELSKLLSNFMLETVHNMSNIVSSIVSVMAITVIVPFMTFFLLKDKNTLIKGIIDIMPNKYFEVSYSVIAKMSEQLGKFVRAWIIDATFVGASAAILFTILGIDNSITIGVVAGIGHLIPYFGPLIGGVPAIIISVVQFGDFSMLPYIILVLAIIYTFDNGYVQPNAFAHGTDIHPLMIIILILMGSKLMGILGMLLAVPAATVIKTAASEIYYGYKYYKIIKA